MFDGFETYDSSMIAYKFNEYFASVQSSLSANFDDEYRSNKKFEYRVQTFRNDFYFILVFITDNKPILHSLKNSAHCCDEKPIAIHEEHYGQLGAIITKIRN